MAKCVKYTEGEFTYFCFLPKETLHRIVKYTDPFDTFDPNIFKSNGERPGARDSLMRICRHLARKEMAERGYWGGRPICPLYLNQDQIFIRFLTDFCCLFNVK